MLDALSRNPEHVVRIGTSSSAASFRSEGGYPVWESLVAVGSCANGAVPDRRGQDYVWLVDSLHKFFFLRTVGGKRLGRSTTVRCGSDVLLTSSKCLRQFEGVL